MSWIVEFQQLISIKNVEEGKRRATEIPVCNRK